MSFPLGNFHAIVSPVVSVVNPLIPATFRSNTGFTTDAAGNRTPTFTDLAVYCQTQPLQYTDIQLMDGLQINGERRQIYVTGRFDSLNRPVQTGGDLVVFAGSATADFPYGTTWKIAIVKEQWPTWCCVLCTLQVTPTP